MELLFNAIARIQSTAYCQTKDSTTDTFLEEKKEFSKIPKISKKYLQNSSLFSNIVGLQPRISDLIKKRAQEKFFFFECSEVAGSFP